MYDAVAKIGFCRIESSPDNVLQHQGLHYLMGRVSANVKILFAQLNTYAPAALRHINFSMNMSIRCVKHENTRSERWPPVPGVKYTARERQASTYVLDVCPGQVIVTLHLTSLRQISVFVVVQAY